MRAFERQDGESAKAFEAWKVYRDLGPERSLDNAWRTHTGNQESTKRAPGRWKKWSVEYDWVARAQAYDDYHEMIRRECIEAYERGKGVERAEREARVQQRVLALKEQFAGRLEQMLGVPLDGTKWNYATVSKALEMLEGRQARLDIRKVNLEHLSDEQLERIANGEDPLQVLIEGDGDDVGY